jgi:hypothetical protein
MCGPNPGPRMGPSIVHDSPLIMHIRRWYVRDRSECLLDAGSVRCGVKAVVTRRSEPYLGPSPPHRADPDAASNATPRLRLQLMLPCLSGRLPILLHPLRPG